MLKFVNKNKIFFLLIFIESVLVLPVLAYNGWSYGYFSPSQLLQNEWVVFGLIFVIFFGLIFIAISRSMKENVVVAGVISIAISLFISLTISQRAMFYGYFGEGIGSWIFVIALIVAIAFFTKFITDLIGGIGLFLSLGFIWLILSNIDPYSLFPFDIIYSPYFWLYEFFISQTFLAILVIAFLIV
ncbi:MAG: hypothetical protein QXF25_01800, partial [Candidatus Pacearchaeota archaeon]